jgi:hypothetical protein
LIYEGATGFAAELKLYGIEAKRMPEWRGKRRDFPGMAAIEDEVLLIEDWRQRIEALKACARVSSRQGQLLFEDPRRLPGSAGLDDLRVRRAV